LPTLEIIIFGALALIAIASAVMMIVTRNAVHSALFLVVVMACLAVFFLGLSGPFIAVVQVAVYAGAIMVLFLFVIMLLNVDREASAGDGRGLRKFGALVLCLAIAFSFISASTMSVFTGAKGVYPPEKVNAIGNSVLIGKALFTDFLLPFEITSVLLLAAIIGAVVLAKKKL
jgi:NADH-quinone oxidoreductase subunit J